VGLQRVYLAADLAGLFVATIATVSWARALIRAKRSPRSVHAVALALPIFDAAILVAPFSPWRGFLFDAPYTGIQVIVTLFFAVITIVQVILWRFASS
jgi:threonine/homoserine efflux transporter RhtA